MRKLKSTENTNKNLITALYCRLSQEDERLGESLSIENQRLMLQRYAEEHHFPNIQFYVDDGFSGADFNRPSFKRMMVDVECGKVGIVIVKDQSRLGRDYLQTGMLMEITFPQYDVRFIAINDGVDSENGVSDFSGIKNYFNDFYARDTSRKIRAVQKAKGERGERVGTTIPYGYMKDPDNPKQFIPNPETAPIVKRIFEMYASGIGIVKICDKLSKEQILSPSVYAFKTTGSKSGNPDLTRPYHWAQTTVRKMLANQEYAGDTVNFKTYSKSNKLKKRRQLLTARPLNLCRSILQDESTPINRARWISMQDIFSAENAEVGCICIEGKPLSLKTITFNAEVFKGGQPIAPHTISEKMCLTKLYCTI